MRIVQKQNPFSKLVAFFKSFGLLNIFFFAIFIAFALAIMAQFANPKVLQNLLSDAAYDPNTRVYQATFDGSPSSPAPITQRNQNEFDIQVHSRDRGSWGDTEIPHMEAQHGPGCEAPDITHTVDHYEKTVFNCRNHMMTAINGAAGYAQIAITPSYIADWKDGELVIKWDMSTLTMSTRDWVSVSVTPWEYNLALIEGDPGETPDLSGAPKESIYINIGQNPFSLCVRDIRNSEQINPVGWVEGNDCDHWDGIGNYLTPSAVNRSTFEVRISPDRVTASLLNPDGTVLKRWHDYRPSAHGFSPIPFNEGVVQFVQHSYTPDKDNSGVPATWHWDNLYISDATPFTMIKADKRHVETDGEVITFNSPAPANSYLRFHAMGNVDVSYDGRPYERAQEPPQDLEPSATFFTPVPEGTKTVSIKFSGRSWYDYEKQAKDFAIWSRSSNVGGTNPEPTVGGVTPTSAPTPIACPTQPPCENGVIAVGDPAPGSENQCPQFFCTTFPTNTPTPPPPTPTITLSKNAVITLQPRTKDVTSGQTLSVDVMVDTAGKSINAVEATISIPSNLLTSPTASIDKNVFGIETGQSVTSNSITVSGASTTPRTGIVRLATLTFKTASQGSAALNFSNVEIVESGTNQDVFGSAQNGSYTIVAVPTPTPTKAPPTPTPTPGQKSADLNRDGKVDIQDLSLLLTYRKNKDLRGDLNNDGKINMTDISILVKNWS